MGKLETSMQGNQMSQNNKGDDPINLIKHTLSNGLTLLLSVNKREPRIFTNIVVKSGSKQDPAETTGLAHYMEHMLFKGTSKIGALDWQKEKVLLEEISDLYEQHRLTDDPEEKSRIYKLIDERSIEAAKLVAPNEYDKLASAIGANATNAYTWVDQTVFVNDIPSNELERWMELESERFRMMALRLFHTELETVYEEFNISQDRDVRKANNLIRSKLFPSHPYGTQTTLGTAEHLKNPSQQKIQNYFETYYVPNNMGIMMSGDFDPNQVIEMADKYFGTFTPKPIPPFNFEEQPEIEEVIRCEVWGQSAPFVDIAWRCGSSQTDDPLFLSFLSSLLSNGEVGLLDQHLNQPQLVLNADCWAWVYQDYSVFGLFGRPRKGQSLQEVADLMLEQLQKIKAGNFDESLMEAIINNYRLQEIREFESNKGRVNTMTEAFVLNVDWDRFVNRYHWYKNLTKEKLMNFANRYLADNYIITYKQQGEDPNVIKVEKPKISSIDLNRSAISTFGEEFLKKEVAPLQPVFADFANDIQRQPLSSGLPLFYVHNSENELFRLDYIFEMGRLNDIWLPIADIYRTYSGTSKYSNDEISKMFFRLGLHFDFYTYDHRSYVTLKGLSQNIEEGIQLVDHILTSTEADQKTVDNLVEDIFTKRENAKKDKGAILSKGMSAYARFGSENPFKYRLSEKELRTLNPQDLTSRINSINNYKHHFYYYGPDNMEQITGLIERHHQVGDTRINPQPRTEFPSLDNQEDVVYFVHFPMVQAEVLMISKGTPQFNFHEYLMRSWYNEYFGYGLSSIVFQEIRESKALAYSTYAYYGTPKLKDKAHFFTAFVGTQPDKLSDALPALFDIIHQMPESHLQIENARLSILKQLESERILPSKLYWEYQANKDVGFHHDLRKDMYHRLLHSVPEDLIAFQKKYVKGRKFNIMVLGDRNRIDLNYLQSFGQVHELTLEDVFGY